MVQDLSSYAHTITDASGVMRIDSEIPTGGMDGIAIGANYGAGGTRTESYAGGIDAVHVYGRALSDAHVCIVAGQRNCRVMSCNHNGPG